MSHEVSYGSPRGSRGVAGAESPLAHILSDRNGRQGCSWGRLASDGRVSVDVLRRIRRGHVPSVDTVRRILAAIDVSPRAAEKVIAWVENVRLARSVGRAARAQCRVCRRWVAACRVRRRVTFRPGTELEPASFVHRDCRGQPGKVTVVCPADGCGSRRRYYWSSNRKRQHNAQRRADGTFTILCKRHKKHHRPQQGRRHTEKRIAGLRRRFIERFTESRYGRRQNAAAVWDLAEAGDLKARGIRQELMGWGRYAKRRPQSAAVRPGLARFNLFKRWARVLIISPKRRSPCSLCPLCWTFVQGRKYHTSTKRNRRSVGPMLCWEVWRDSVEFQREREERRQSQKKLGRRPIDPPVPGFVGHLPHPENVARKFGWFLASLGGATHKELAAMGCDGRHKGFQDLASWPMGNCRAAPLSGRNAAARVSSPRKHPRFTRPSLRTPCSVASEF
jgi:hypothetical protein